jgi:hypothetical protein
VLVAPSNVRSSNRTNMGWKQAQFVRVVQGGIRF